MKTDVRAHYDEGQFDSALITLRNWIEIHGYSLINYRTNILLHIAAGRFSEDLYGASVIDNILIERRSDQGSTGAFYYWDQPQIDWSFEPFTQRVARDVASRSPDGSVARLLAEYFGGIEDSIFTCLRQPGYASTKLRLYHELEVRRLEHNSTGGNFNFYTGAWMPTGDATSLSTHPLLGTMMGGTLQGYRYDLVGELRLVDATHRFTVIRGDDTLRTTDYLGFYVGLEGGRDLIRSPRHDLYVSGGFGVDGFSYDNLSDEIPRHSVTAFAATVGAGYRFHLERYALRYIGLQAMYHIIDYNRIAGPQLGGNAVAIRLMIGWGGNESANAQLRELAY